MSDSEQTLKLLIDILRAKVVDFNSEPPLELDADGHEVTWKTHEGVAWHQTLTLTPYNVEARRSLKIRALTDWIREMGTHVRLEPRPAPVSCGTEADIREAMGYSHIADKAVEYLDLDKEVAERHAIRAKAQADHVKATSEAMTEALAPVAAEFAAKHGLEAPSLSFEQRPCPPGSYAGSFDYSNIPRGEALPRENFERAVREMREQADGLPLFGPPVQVDPAAIRARANAARPAPWIHEYFHGTVMLPGAIGEPFGCESTRDDMVFIGYAREDVPQLLDVIDVLARLLLNPGHEIEYEGERVFTYRPGEVIEALAALGLDTVEKRDAARSKLSWSGGGSLR